VACLAEGTPGATFGNMNQSICSRLKSLLAPSGINVQTYLLTRLSQLKQKSLEYQGGTLKSLHYRAGAAA